MGGQRRRKPTRPKVPTRHSFRLTAYLIKTTLSRPACAENDAVHGPCNGQTKRERVAAERQGLGWGREVAAERLLNLGCNCHHGRRALVKAVLHKTKDAEIDQSQPIVPFAYWTCHCLRAVCYVEGSLSPAYVACRTQDVELEQSRLFSSHSASCV